MYYSISPKNLATKKNKNKIPFLVCFFDGIILKLPITNRQEIRKAANMESGIDLDQNI